MKKEIVIAILIGAVLGLVLAGANRWQSLKKKVIYSPAVTTQAPTKSPPKTSILTPSPGINLSISNPENETVVNKTPIEIKGLTAAGATVVLIGNEDEVILAADKTGQFKTDFNLSGGINDIEITAYDNNGNEAKKIITVTYSTAKF